MAKTNGELRCTIKSFENGHAVLDFGPYGRLTVAKRYLPRYAKEGDSLSIEIFTDQQATRRRQHLAKAILEEILNGK